MTKMPRSYTERRNLIAQKLEPYFHISNLIPTNLAPAFEPAPGLRPNSLMCSWGDPATGDNKLFVYISQVADGERKANSIREMMTNEAPPDPGQPPEEADAYEIPGQRPGEYVFVLNYLGRLTALVGDCWIDIAPMPVSFPLRDIAEVALDIGRTVGCSSYVNDFQPPALQTQHDPPVWTTADGLIYDPRTPPQP
jgi:hypothetical protein